MTSLINNILIVIFCFINASQQRTQEDIIYHKTETNLDPLVEDIQLESENSKSEIFQDYEDKCKIRESMKSTNDFFFFIPVLKAKLKPSGGNIKFTNTCFKINKLSFVKFSKDETIISFEASEPSGWFCSDTYLISTYGHQQIKFIFQGGYHSIVLTNLTEGDMADIRVNGVHIISSCDGLFSNIKSFFQTIGLYLGGFSTNTNAWLPFMRPNITGIMERFNIAFLSEFMNYKQVHRGEWGQKIIDIDEKMIKSGDFLAITRLDGIDPIVMLGTGARIGHTAVCLWIDGELYVVESTDGWYWPKAGIQRNKWKDWIQYASASDKLVAHFPLKPEIRAKFDEKKAIEFFTSVEGLNYGFHNFVFSWLDTEKDNFPEFVDPEVVMVLVNLFSKYVPSIGNTMFGEGLNKRLGTSGLSVTEAIIHAAEKGISNGSLFAIPEQEWEYSDGKSYVCSCFTAALYKASGLFGDLDVNPFEVSPRDIYQLALYDKDYKHTRPNICKEADPDLDYCQIMGRYKIILDNYSSIELYDGMNEKCPSIAPLYIRPEGC
jgi:hypothetical protein